MSSRGRSRSRGAGRPTINLDDLKDRILDLHHQSHTYLEIASQVGSTERTIKRRLAQWGVRRRAPGSQRTDLYLRSQVALYFMSGFTDNETVLALNTETECVHKHIFRRI